MEQYVSSRGSYKFSSCEFEIKLGGIYLYEDQMDDPPLIARVDFLYDEDGRTEAVIRTPGRLNLKVIGISYPDSLLSLGILKRCPFTLINQENAYKLQEWFIKEYGPVKKL